MFTRGNTVASKRIQEIVARFVAELQEASEKEASETLMERLRSVGSTSKDDAVPAKRRRGRAKGYKIQRPCPVPGCKEMAASRYGMVCKGHGATLTQDEKLAARANAQKPGGVWADLKKTA